MHKIKILKIEHYVRTQTSLWWLGQVLRRPAHRPPIRDHFTCTEKGWEGRRGG